MPLPSDPRTIFLGGLFLLAALAAAYSASEILLPLMFAITLKLLLQPVMRLLEGLKLPRIIAALLIIFISARGDRHAGRRAFRRPPATGRQGCRKACPSSSKGSAFSARQSTPSSK